MPIAKLALLSDYALLANDLKPSVLGIFSTIRVSRLPALHASSYLTYQLELRPEDAGQPVVVMIECFDPSGEPLFRVEGEGTLSASAGIEGEVEAWQVVKLPPFQVGTVGEHKVNLSINLELVATLPLTVLLAAGQE